ncbi:MAG: phospho-N-acetylmuramoyl-pentapeptide-transferase, partial [Lachnospiraceae bacterium]|nr:phospho-N-acetylmuramoyl-pentapeptide-transferase [Lachnospiraceae bacterium]
LGVYLLRETLGYNTYIKIPIVNLFIRNIKLDFSNLVFIIVIVIINVFILVGTQNGVNFTDGLDSLLANVTIVVTIFYIIESILKFNLSLCFVNIAMLSLLFALRKYNKYPAKVFMGDTGSLMLGAYVGGMALLLDIQYFLPIFGFVYMMEVISVILQVSYFKMTKGKRIFKMAPIHHHFEKCGWSENKVVNVFTIITIIACIISFVLIWI